MKKKLIILWVFLLMVCWYCIWWNRGGDYPKVDESLFVSDDNPVSREENLAYTFIKTEWRTMEDIVNQHVEQDIGNENIREIENHYNYRGPGFSNYSAIFQLQSMRKYDVQLPEEIWNKGEKWTKDSYVNSWIDMSLKTYLTVMKIPALYQKLSDLEILSGNFLALKNQDFYMGQNSYDAYYEIMFSWVNSTSLQQLGRAMSNIVMYLTMIGKYDQAFDYWKAGYLLGEKLMKGGNPIYSLIGGGIYKMNLFTLYFLQEHFGLSEQVKEKYYRFLLDHSISAEDIYRWSVLREYWFYNNMFSHLKKWDSVYLPLLEESINAKGLFKLNKWTKYIDYERTEKMLKYAYSLVLKFQYWILESMAEDYWWLKNHNAIINQIVEIIYEKQPFLLKRNIGWDTFILENALRLSAVFSTFKELENFYGIVLKTLQ